MAVLCTHPSIIVPKDQTRKIIRKESMLCSSQRRPTRVPTALAKSTKITKVFEDEAMGIVCHRDGKGEIVCEGYDEGPRYSHRLPENKYRRRDKDREIPKILQIGEDTKIYQNIQQQNKRNAE